MSDEQKHSPQHEDVVRSHLKEQQQVKEVFDFINKYSKPIMIVLLAVVAAVLADRFIKARGQSREAKAESILLNARTPDQLRTIIADYGSTAAAPMAMMSLARERFNSGNTAEAQKLFEQFLGKYPNHECAPIAQLNLITCRESLGQLGEAHQLYDKFATEHRSSYLVPMAILGKARCLEELGKFDEARQAYEDLLPNAGWSDVAEANLKLVAAEKDK